MSEQKIAPCDDLTAREICEHQITTSARALLDNRFDLMEDLFAIPSRVETFSGWTIIETHDDLRATFDRVRQHYSSLGVTALHRRCIEAEFSAPDRMQSTHECRVLRGNQLLIEPYPIYSVSRLVDGRWRIAESSYAVIDAPKFVEAVMGRTG